MSRTPALPPIETLSSGLRGSAWLTPRRAAAYARLLLVVTLALAAADVAVAVVRGGWDFAGKPLGTDFLCFWTAARLALAGTPADAYAPAVQYALERATFPGPDPGYYAFIYPPITLLLCLPLGLLPYFGALLAWLTITGAAYGGVLWAMLGRDRRLVPAIVAFPAVLVTCGHGQNAFLTTALFGGGLLLLHRRPAPAGILFGALIIKPHLGLLIPVYLLAGGYGVAFAAAGGTVVVGALLSLLAFGPAAWSAYLQAAALARTTLEQGLVEPEKMQSVFAAVRLWHGPLWLAYGAQGLSAAIVAAVLVATVRRRRGAAGDDPAGTGALLVTAALLATPYVLDYDLTLLAIPLAWLLMQGRHTGFHDWEKLIALAGFLLPLVSRMVATASGVPLGPFVVGALFWAVSRRVAGTAVPVEAARVAPHLDLRPA